MVKRKKIGIDLDSTLNNLNEVWIERYNKDYCDNLTQEDIVKWEINEIVKPECGENIFEYLHEPNFFYNLNIKDDAKETVDFLAKNYELYIVTAYSPDTCLDKSNWIKKHKLNIDDKNIIFINNKGLLDLDYLIDDGPHNFDNFSGNGLLFDMPYNKHIKSNKKLKRVETWTEVKDFFKMKLKEKE